MSRNNANLMTWEKLWNIQQYQWQQPIMETTWATSLLLVRVPKPKLSTFLSLGLWTRFQFSAPSYSVCLRSCDSRCDSWCCDGCHPDCCDGVRRSDFSLVVQKVGSRFQPWNSTKKQSVLEQLSFRRTAKEETNGRTCFPATEGIPHDHHCSSNITFTATGNENKCENSENGGTKCISNQEGPYATGKVAPVSGDGYEKVAFFGSSSSNVTSATNVHVNQYDTNEAQSKLNSSDGNESKTAKGESGLTGARPQVGTCRDSETIMEENFPLYNNQSHLRQNNTQNSTISRKAEVKDDNPKRFLWATNSETFMVENTELYSNKEL